MLISGKQTLRQRVVPEINKDISERESSHQKKHKIKQTFKIDKAKFDWFKGSLQSDLIPAPLSVIDRNTRFKKN